MTCWINSIIYLYILQYNIIFYCVPDEETESQCPSLMISVKWLNVCHFLIEIITYQHYKQRKQWSPEPFTAQQRYILITITSLSSNQSQMEQHSVQVIIIIILFRTGLPQLAEDNVPQCKLDIHLLAQLCVSVGVNTYLITVTSFAVDNAPRKQVF